MTFIIAPKNCENDTKNSPWFLIQKFLQAIFQLFDSVDTALGNGDTPLDCPNDEIVLIDNLLKASGSSNEASALFAGLGDKYVRLLLPLRARSKLLGIFCKDSNRSPSSLSRLGFAGDIWGIGLYADMITRIHCRRSGQGVSFHES